MRRGIAILILPPRKQLRVFANACTRLACQALPRLYCSSLALFFDGCVVASAVCRFLRWQTLEVGEAIHSLAWCTNQSGCKVLFVGLAGKVQAYAEGTWVDGESQNGFVLVASTDIIDATPGSGPTAPFCFWWCGVGALLIWEVRPCGLPGVLLTAYFGCGCA